MSRYKAKLNPLIPVFTQTAAVARPYLLVSLNASDVPAMAALQTRTGPSQIVPRDADYYSAHFASQHTAIGFVDSNNTLIAHALIRTDRETTTMLNVLVDPLHRGQQLQTQMIRQWLDVATAAGITTATARIRIGNAISLKNFDAAGMVICTTEPSPEEPEAMTHVMKKSLQESTVRNVDFRPSLSD